MNIMLVSVQYTYMLSTLNNLYVYIYSIHLLSIFIALFYNLKDAQFDFGIAELTEKLNIDQGKLSYLGFGFDSQPVYKGLHQAGYQLSERYKLIHHLIPYAPPYSIINSPYISINLLRGSLITGSPIMDNKYHVVAITPGQKYILYLHVDFD